MPIFSENSAPVTPASLLIINVGGVSQSVFPNQKRSYLLVQNNSDTDMWLGIGTTPSVNNGIRLLPNGGGYVAEDGFIPSGEVRIFCTAGGKQFYALQGG